MSDPAIVYAIMGVAVGLFVWNRIPVEMVAVGVALALYATGVLELEQALAGFGDPTVIFIASLFVVSASLDATGVTTWAGQQLLARVGDSRTRLIVLMMLLVAALTALISVNAAVSALLPMVVVIAVRLGRSPSKLLMPLAFGAHAGSMLLLTGTPVNIIVADLADDAGLGRFNFFEFGLAGIPLVVGSIAIVVLIGDRVLPDRVAATIPRDLSQHGLTLARQYDVDVPASRHRVREGSPLVGRCVADVGLDGHPGVVLAGVTAHPTHALRDDHIEAGDVVVLHGDVAAVARVVADLDLDPAVGPPVPETSTPLISRRFGVVEVVVPPRSAMVGSTVFPGMVTDSGELVILAIQRRGEPLGPRPSVLAAGDTLLVQGTWDAIKDNVDDPEVLVVDDPALVQRQAVALGPRAGRSIAILVVMVVLLASGAVAPAVAGLLAAFAVVLGGVVSVEQAYRSVSWTTVLLVAGMLPLSVALTESGAAETLADRLLDVVGDAGPYALLAGVFVITALLGQLISNTATAIVVAPIALSAALESGVSGQTALMSVAVAAAASFLTPVATPMNTVIMEPGAYRFGDYWKLGLPLMGWFFVVSVLWVPVIWGS